MNLYHSFSFQPGNTNDIFKVSLKIIYFTRVLRLLTNNDSHCKHLVKIVDENNVIVRAVRVL